MSEPTGYGVRLTSKDAKGNPVGAAHDLAGLSPAVRAKVISALRYYAHEPTRLSEPTSGFQVFTFKLVTPEGPMIFVCPFQYYADEETIEIRGIFHKPA
ncbi:MAG: hypothetical protein ACAI43_14545 [Phycisphaerae bacterium]|nr:hypothetical protein [Tepidisphaeraceae bacterium]